MPREIRQTVLTCSPGFTFLNEIAGTPASDKIDLMASVYLLGQKEAKVIREYINRTN
jgi:hypothetical protein